MFQSLLQSADPGSTSHRLVWLGFGHLSRAVAEDSCANGAASSSPDIGARRLPWEKELLESTTPRGLWLPQA